MTGKGENPWDLQVPVIDEDVLKKFYYERYNLGTHCIYRRVLIMQKSGILGNIADYKLLDFIVPDLTMETLMPFVKPVPDVMTQRFLLFGKGSMLRKSFAFGLKGWAYVGFLLGEEKIFEDMRRELREAIRPSGEGLGK